jgi:hypothetical protein
MVNRVFKNFRETKASNSSDFIFFGHADDFIFVARATLGLSCTRATLWMVQVAASRSWEKKSFRLSQIRNNLLDS